MTITEKFWNDLWAKADNLADQYRTENPGKFFETQKTFAGISIQQYSPITKKFYHIKMVNTL